MVLLNLWSVGHFCQWFLVGRFLNLSWTLFLVLSIGWELLELGYCRTNSPTKLGQQIFRHRGKLLWFLLGQSLQTRVLNLDQNGFLGSS